MHDSSVNSLDDALTHSGYYPGLVRGVLDVALAGEEPQRWLVHPETTFDDRVRRHLTALVLTPTRLICAHVDDDPEGPGGGGAMATTESVPIHRITSVGLTHGTHDPGRVGARDLPAELTIAIHWGAVRRTDIEPAQCPDPNCEADHGYTGLQVPEDVVVRVSALAAGDEAVRDALTFARVLSRATVHATR